ncbi:unnamed protein product, partial [Acanthocheilonema viteae]
MDYAAYQRISNTTVSSFATQRPQAIVTPMTATITVSEPVNQGITQLSTISDTTSITTAGINSNNYGNVLDHHITAMIDNSHSTITDSDLMETKKIDVTDENNQQFSPFLTITDYSIISSTKSQSCLSPVIEDSNSSDNNSYLTTDSISTVASISSSARNVNASETTIRLIAPSDTVSSSIATSHLSSAKGERMVSSSKSTSSSPSTHSLSNRNITDKRHSSSTRMTNSRTNESLTKSELITNTGTKVSRTRLHRSPINHSTTNANGSNVTTNSNIVENMRKVLESRLNITLPSGRSQLSASLADGVKLCNFANRIRLRAVNSLFTPVSEELPLSSPKCRRNVNSFLAACRRIGVPE